MPDQKIITLYEHDEKKYESILQDIRARYGEPHGSIDKRKLQKIFLAINSHFKNQLNQGIVSNDNPDIEEKLDESKAVLEVYPNKVKARHYVGFATFGEVFVQVLPKVFKPNNNIENEDSTWSSIMAFIRMLDLAYGLKIREYDLAHLKGRKLQPNLYEIFIYLFAKSLWDEIQRGYYREYIELRSEEKFLRGKLLLSRQIRKLPHQLNNFSVEVHELIEDNLLNQVFYASIRMALGKTRWQTNKKLLGELMLVFDGVTPIRLTREHFECVHFTRLNERFRKPFELAKLLFMPPLGGGGNRTVIGFFVDMNELFERFIEKVLRRNISFRYDLFYQDQYLFLKSDRNNTLYQKPDYVIKEHNIPIIVLDAKYREFKENMPSSDMARQLYVYVKILEHESIRKSKNQVRLKIPAVLIFPVSENYNRGLKENKCLEFEFFDGAKLYVVGYDLEYLKNGRLSRHNIEFMECLAKICPKCFKAEK